MLRRLALHFLTGLCAVLAACFGGQEPEHQAAAAAPSDATAPTAPAAGLQRVLGVMPAQPDPLAERLFDFAEARFPAFFPGPALTLAEGAWRYRSYMQTGVLLGIRDGQVHVTGGPFGSGLTAVGRVTDFVAEGSRALPVRRSSYENKAYAGRLVDPIPTAGLPVSRFTPNEEVTAGIALADFFQDGQLSIVAFSNTFNDPNGPATLAGRAYFFRRVNGRWVDATATLLPDQTGCISPRKLLVADFNGDARPDVFASCTGYDAPVNGKLPGEHPRLLLSQPDGRYSNVPLPLVCYCHSAAAADFDGSGFADIVLQDNALEGVVMFVNQRDGTFRMDRTRVPESARQHGGQWTRSIWTVELADLYGSGRYDLFLGGVDLTDCSGCGWSWTSKIYRAQPAPGWSDSARVVLPSLPGRATDVYDMLHVDGRLYLLRDGPAKTLAELSMAIQRIDLATLESTVAYEHSGPFSNGYTTMMQWIVLHDGRIQGLYDYPAVSIAP